MATTFQVTFDSANPRSLAHFWTTVLGYVDQPPPEGFSSWKEVLDQMGVPEKRWEDKYAIIDPKAGGPRLLFQRVPEGKEAKNRVHLDVNVGEGLDGDARRERVDEEVGRVTDLGATELYSMGEYGEYWVVMQDPEGNEFCLQ
ncbi:MAG: VOC family protein [Streptosporangiaceae bacterium]